MDRTAARRRIRNVVYLLAAGALAACSDSARSPVEPGGALAAAKGGGSTTVSVSATSPSYGSPGQVNETVTITGSGFKSGAQAQWLLTNNTADTTIAVASTQYVSSTQLTSVISISPNSPIAFRNVQVTNADRTKGIGSAVFEVTQAVSVSGSSVLRGANDNGEITGNGNGGPAYWSSATGLLTIDASGGTGFTISPMGNAISANNYPALETRAGRPARRGSGRTCPSPPRRREAGPRR
jgi:IPT/TIG domain